MDAELLQLVRTQANYNRFQPYIKPHALSKEGLLIYNSMGDYFKDYPAALEIHWPTFESWFFVLRNSSITPADAPVYRTIFTNLRSMPAAPSAVMDDVLDHYITLDYKTRIANECVSGTGPVIDNVRDLCVQYEREVGRAFSLDTLFVSDDVKDTLESARGPGLDWRLRELNVSCGPLRKGDFVIVGARPETGKTTFLASEVSYMASQIKDDRPVIWVNNEERSDKVKLRIMQAALGISIKDFEANPAKCMKDYQTLMGKEMRVLVTGSSSGLNSVQSLIPLFREHNPALIVFDQLDKVEGFSRKSDKEDQRLGDLYLWARQLAHQYGPVITASQASDSAEGEPWIFQNQLRGSRTDKPGEADLILTIGKVHDKSKENVRYLHVAKNKLHGGPISEEEHRHAYWEVTIDPTVARYKGTR